MELPVISSTSIEKSDTEEKGLVQIPYYPGCTLNTVAKDFDQSARVSARILGFELAELNKWNCCGASFPLTPDNIIGLTGPANVLISAKREGEQVATMCSFCYNTLKRTNRVMKEEDDSRNVVNDFLETDYKGEVKVIHLLEVLRDVVGFEKLKSKVVRPFKDLKVAAYYGCMLLRPHQEIGMDPNHESPTIFETFLKALSCKPVDYPHKGECCGSHLAMSDEKIVVRLSGQVVDSAREAGAELITTSCPLCFYNLERAQQQKMSDEKGYQKLPVIYFTQILGLALGQDLAALGFTGNGVDPIPLLKEQGIV
ncbi:MAG: CoB--CoM heterodisulfide reductase iron-sulfur subunit B family protein [Nitrospiria bacterium]